MAKKREVSPNVNKQLRITRPQKLPWVIARVEEKVS